MSVTKALEALRAYPNTASAEFRGQLDKVDRARQSLGKARTSPEANTSGIDRSKAFEPVRRPLLKAFVGEA